MISKILIQGPIYDNTPFIYNEYKKKGFDVIVSTYSNTDKNYLNYFDENNLIISELPPNMGNYNRNGHRLTANKGLNRILEQNHNCFVLKTRSDHYFKKIKEIIEKFEKLIQKFPLYSDNQNFRIVIPNAGTTSTEIWGKYHLADHWMYGHILDVYDYYTLENVDLNKDFQIEQNYSPEPEFCGIWMSNKKILESFEELLAKRFIIVDNQRLNYTIAKNCSLKKCTTDWDKWNSTDDGVITNKKWKKLIKQYSI